MSSRTQSVASRLWVPEINLVRGFAILSVIFIHVTAYFGRSSVLIPIVFVNMVADAFFHYAVPLFLMISGLVLSLAYWRGGSTIQFYKKRFKSIIPQYIIFSCLYIAFAGIVLGWTVNLETVIGDLLTGTAWAHLWFIPLIIELYLLYPVLVRIYSYFESKSRVRTLLGAAFAIQFSFSVAQVLTNTVIIGEDWASQLIFNSFIAYIFYFFAGIYLGRNIEAIKKRVKSANVPMLALLAAVSGLVASLYFSTRYFDVPAGLPMEAAYLAWSLAIPLVTMAMFVLFFRLSSRRAFYSSRVGYFIGEMGTYAFGIYLIHALFITGYELVLTRLLDISMESVWFYVLLATLTVASSYLFVKVVERLPYGDVIIGVKTRKQVPESVDASSSYRV